MEAQLNIRRGTTPTLLFLLDFDHTKVGKCFLTLQQAGTVLEFEPLVLPFSDAAVPDIKSQIRVRLTQSQTLGFGTGYNALINVQIRVLDTDGLAWATDEVGIEVLPILKEGVI